MGLISRVSSRTYRKKKNSLAMAESSANDSYDPRSVRQDPKPDAHHRDRNGHTDYQNNRNSARDRDRSPHRGGSRDYRQQPTHHQGNYQNQRNAQNNNYHRNDDRARGREQNYEPPYQKEARKLKAAQRK